MRASIVAGIDRTSYMNRSKLYGYLTVLDICFSCFIIAPLVVAFWSSTWSSLRFIQFSTHPSLNVLVPIAFGYSVAILFTTFQKHIQVSWTLIENMWISIRYWSRVTPFRVICRFRVQSYAWFFSKTYPFRNLYVFIVKMHVLLIHSFVNNVFAYLLHLSKYNFENVNRSFNDHPFVFLGIT